MDQNW